MRGAYTNELKEKYGITVEELRLIPYLQYCLLNSMPIDPNKIAPYEREILKKWRDENKITFSCQESCTCTKEFWDWMNEILWDSYVPQMEVQE